MFGLIAAGLISPFYVDITPEVRSSYVSLGKVVEDRPMQITRVRAGWDTGMFGRVGVYNWDVSSLTDRRSDVHRHCLYHTEVGPTWSYDIEINNEWTLKNDLMCAWTLYRGFDKESSNGDYWWWQVAQSLENPYVVPYYRMRRYVSGSYFFWFEIGVRRKFRFWEDFYVMPVVYVDGGNAPNYERVFGKNVNGGEWGSGGVSSVTFRIECGWSMCSWVTAFAFAEQYEVVGEDARDTNSQSSYLCAHNDLTIIGVGVRLVF